MTTVENGQGYLLDYVLLLEIRQKEVLFFFFFRII